MTDPNARSTVARGHNLVVFAPPSPAGTAFVLLGLLDRLTAARPNRQPGAPPVLALAPAVAVPEWSRIAERLRDDRAVRVAGAINPARVRSLLENGDVDLLFTSPATATELVGRASLKLGALTGALVLWPEAWGEGGDDLLAGLFQDLPKDTQRIIVTSDPEGSAPAIERYGWRAPISDQLDQASGFPPPGSPIRTTPAAWERRVGVLRDVVEELAPDTLAIWLAHPLDRELVERGVAAAGLDAVMTTETPPPATLIIAYDLPAPARLRELATAGEVLLLVPPAGEAYASRLAPNRRPLYPEKALGRAREVEELTRRRIAETIQRGLAPARLLALAPLFERYEATAVAAAAYELWQQSAGAPGLTPAPAAPAAEPRERVWIAIGKRDAVTPHDLVATLTREGRVPKEAIGKIEIRETFSLIEIAAGANPEQVAQRLTGKTIRKRRLVARVDRKP